MFAAGTSVDQRRAALSVIAAPALPMVTQELARVGDVVSLRILKDLGAFNFDWTDLTVTHRTRRHPVLVGEALPMVDAVAAIVENQVQVHTAWRGSMQMRSEVTTLVPRLNASEDLRRFVRDLCAETIEALKTALDDACEARRRGDIHDKPLQEAFACVERTLDVIGAVACAMDDPHLFRDCREGSKQRRGGVLGSAIFSGAMGEVTPTAIALYFHSAKALLAIGPEAFDEPVVGHAVGDPDAGRWLYEDVLQTQESVPDPALVFVMLTAMRRPDGTFGTSDAKWIKDTLVHMACRGDWGHLLPMLIADHPEALAVDWGTVKRFAIDHALPDLMAIVLPTLNIQAPITDQPDLWFPRRHPVSRLLDCAHNNAIDHGDIDATLAMVLQAMIDRGQIGDVIDPAQTGPLGHWTGHTCAHFGFASSMALLVDAGLDPSMKNPLGLSVLDVAERDGRTVVANMLRAAGARRAAMAAIGEMTPESAMACPRSGLGHG